MVRSAQASQITANHEIKVCATDNVNAVTMLTHDNAARSVRGAFEDEKSGSFQMRRAQNSGQPSQAQYLRLNKSLARRRAVCDRRASNGSKRTASARGGGILGRIEGVCAASLWPFSG